MIRYYLHVDPNTLTDEEWATAYNDFIWVRKKEAEGNAKALNLNMLR